MGRIIGIDYGVKRIGLAVTDPLQIFASPLMTVMTTEFYKFITGYLETDDVDAFVIGYPVQMNNQPSASVTYINPFIKRLKKTYPEKHIYLADERFTSQMAIRTMVEGGVKKRDRQDKSLVDKISASIILQSFLDNRSNKKENIKQE
jgi:putative Holliday junction resolvase